MKYNTTLTQDRHVGAQVHFNPSKYSLGSSGQLKVCWMFTTGSSKLQLKISTIPPEEDLEVSKCSKYNLDESLIWMNLPILSSVILHSVDILCIKCIFANESHSQLHERKIYRHDSQLLLKEGLQWRALDDPYRLELPLFWFLSRGTCDRVTILSIRWRGVFVAFDSSKIRSNGQTYEL